MHDAERHRFEHVVPYASHRIKRVALVDAELLRKLDNAWRNLHEIFLGAKIERGVDDSRCPSTTFAALTTLRVTPERNLGGDGCDFRLRYRDRGDHSSGFRSRALERRLAIDIGDDAEVVRRTVFERKRKMDANALTRIVVREIDVPFETQLKTFPVSTQAVDQ